jgi:hypothetical protein
LSSGKAKFLNNSRQTQILGGFPCGTDGINRHVSCFVNAEKRTYSTLSPKGSALNLADKNARSPTSDVRSHPLKKNTDRFCRTRVPFRSVWRLNDRAGNARSNEVNFRQSHIANKQPCSRLQGIIEIFHCKGAPLQCSRPSFPQPRNVRYLIRTIPSDRSDIGRKPYKIQRFLNEEFHNTCYAKWQAKSRF